jgi:hypothetical protein
MMMDVNVSIVEATEAWISGNSGCGYAPSNDRSKDSGAAH